MKIINMLLVFVLISFITFTNAKNLNDPADTQAIRQTIESYSKGIDNRNSETLQKVIYHGAYFINYNKSTNKITEMTNDELIDRVKNRKVGGWERELNINSVDVNGNTAVARVEITDAKLKQTGFVTLVKDNDSWKIVCGAYTLETLK